MDGLDSGLDICAALSRLRGGELFRWSVPPKLLMRLFAKELYKIRIAFEEAGRLPIRARLVRPCAKRTGWCPTISRSTPTSR